MIWIGLNLVSSTMHAEGYYLIARTVFFCCVMSSIHHVYLALKVTRQMGQGLYSWILNILAHHSIENPHSDKLISVILNDNRIKSLFFLHTFSCSLLFCLRLICSKKRLIGFFLWDSNFTGHFIETTTIKFLKDLRIYRWRESFCCVYGGWRKGTDGQRRSYQREVDFV